MFCDQSRSKRRPGATTWRFGLSQIVPKNVHEAPKVPQEPPRRFLPLTFGFDPLAARRLLAVRLLVHFHTKVWFSCGKCWKNEDSANPAFRTPPRTLRSQPACKACRHCQRQLLHMLRHAKEGSSTPGATSARRIPIG